MFLKDKRDESIKARGCLDRKLQNEYTSKVETISHWKQWWPTFPAHFCMQTWSMIHIILLGYYSWTSCKTEAKAIQ